MQFTGAVPASLCSLEHLEHISLAHNKLTGPIPSGMERLQKLEKLEVRNGQHSAVAVVVA